MPPSRTPFLGAGDPGARGSSYSISSFLTQQRRATLRKIAGLNDFDEENDDDMPDLEADPYDDFDATAQDLVVVDPEEVGMTADCKNLYSGKEDKHGRFRWQTTIPKDLGKPAEDADSERYAIVVRHVKVFHNPKKSLSVHSILVQSPLLKQLLGKVLAGYPRFTVGLKRLEFTGRFEPLVHRWADLRKAIDQLKQEVPADQPNSTKARKLQHAELLSGLLTRELKDTIESSRDMKNKGVVTFELLWILFQPNSYVFSKQQGQDRILSLKTAQHMEDRHGYLTYSLRCKFIEYDGARFGDRNITLTIPYYEGTCPIVDLPVFPLNCYGEIEEIKSKLIKRGQKFEDLAGSHFRAYNGVGWRPGMHGTKECYTIKGRIIVDAFGWNRYNPELYISVKPFSSLASNESPQGLSTQSRRYADPGLFDDDLDIPGGAIPEDGFFGDEDESVSQRQTLTEEQKMLCSPIVRGYALKEKLWLNFFVNSVQEVTFDDGAFESLQLPKNQKELLLGFTSTHRSYSSQFDDVITGKGRGIIVLLCGPPGVGKTLTAESIAEHMKVPLFMMAAGDLGAGSYCMEDKLNNILDMCTRWGAILLLDEADVFLEERSLHELERNRLVSIFLRALEYYQGMMFLTTNRVSTFDAAFQSRIHVSIEYQELNLEARTGLWQNFLKQHNIAQAKARENPPRALVSAPKTRDSKSAVPGDIQQGEEAMTAAENELHLRQTQPHQITGKEMEKLASFKINGRQIKNFLKTAQLLANSKAEALSYEHISGVLDMTQHLHNAARENSLTKTSYFT